MRLYRFGRATLGFALKAYFRQTAQYVERVPMHGPFVLTANHVSYLDPPALGVACPRPVHFMAKAELFDLPVLGKLMPELGAFPVHRGAADRAAIRRALELLEQGEVVGVFPEGTRSRTGDLLAPQGGAAMLALKAGVPVVPAAIWGTDRVDGVCHLPRPVKIGVRFGEPLSFARPDKIDREVIHQTSGQIMQAIAQLLAEVNNNNKHVSGIYSHKG